jgi:hypothetical protein
MIKTIIKEIIIFILLLATMVLLLGVLFYDYVPQNKPIPAKVEPYVLPEEVKEEINIVEEEGQIVIKTYYIDSSDLRNYERADKYDKGKINPFEQYTSQVPTETDNNGTPSGSSSESGGSTNNNNTATNPIK